MGLKQQIKFLMEEESSNNCKIPYTTLRSIMLDGVTNVRISTLSV